MPNTTIDPARITEYEAERAQIMRRYTPELKEMASNDPRYPQVWNARADALRELSDKYAMPAEASAR
jgi:hypothetical protein